MSILVKSFIALARLPILAIAVAPSNPTALCDRFIGEKEQAVCEERVAKDKVDWYAATACGLSQDDGQFWKCWDKIKDASFNPDAVEKCADDSAMKDAERVACIDKARVGRNPASEFQPLRIGK